ncbi:MAG: DUF4363 family protein [Clostridia bacterium]
MKRFIFIISLFTITLALCILESVYILDSFTFLETKLNQTSIILANSKDNISTKENVEFLKTLHSDWSKKKHVLKILVWHTGLKDVEVGLSRLKSYTEENNYTEAYAELKNLLDFTAHYKQDFKVSFENIF